jgi:hypothetical protein
MAMPDLDVDNDDAPLRFRTLEDLLGPAPPPGHAKRALVAELLAAIGEEPV